MTKARLSLLAVSRLLQRVAATQIVVWGRHAALDLLLFVLTIYRNVRLKRVTFIGVTGSCGKTTTKELIAGVLSTTLSTDKSRGGRNTTAEAIRSVLRSRTSRCQFVHELSIGKAFGRSTIEGPLRLLRPKIGVVTNIGTDHRRLFHTREEIAAEKGKLVAALPADGIAVLNADDPFVLEMATRCAGRVITYGTAAQAMIRATDVRSVWPERLTFTVHQGDESHPVRTQMCGAHWVHSVLAALAVAVSRGVPLKTAVEAVQAVAPFPGRMSPTQLPTGVTFVRDDAKAPILSFPPALEFMGQAQASRKIVVVGTISDYAGTSKTRYLQIARQAKGVADYVFFVGPMAPRCLSAKQHPDDKSLRVFATLRELAAHLRTFLQPGDLVLVKGSPVDRLDLLAKLLTRPATPEAPAAGRAQALAPRPPLAAEPGTQVIVGLGNGEEQYRNTRHNIGQRVVETIAARQGAQWTREDQAMVARTVLEGRPICLIKLLTSMNTSGPALRRLSQRLAFEAEDCVLVYDDMDLPVGKVRERLRGGAGGHNGVLSIITSFQSEDFRRVKLGIGRPSDKSGVKAFVLSDFSAAEEPGVRTAVTEACALVASALAKRGVLASRPAGTPRPAEPRNLEAQPSGTSVAST
jgi:aminoacyl-tRNA hydrolase